MPTSIGGPNGARLRRGRQEACAAPTSPSTSSRRPTAGEVLAGGLTISNIRRRAAQHANLGYWMGEPFAGRGLMTEAVGLVLPYFFDTLGLHRLHAAFLPHNAGEPPRP